MSIIGKNIIFRAIEEKDLPLMVQWRNNPDVNYYFYEHEPLSMPMQKKWFDNYLQHINTDKIFIIDEIASGNTIGMVSIYHIDWRNRKAEWGRLMLVGDIRGKGYGKEIEIMIYTYVFEHLNLNKLCCEVYAFNDKVVSTHEKMGSKIEGILRKHIFRHGEYQDIVVMGILREDYLALKAQGSYAFK